MNEARAAIFDAVRRALADTASTECSADADGPDLAGAALQPATDGVRPAAGGMAHFRAVLEELGAGFAEALSAEAAADWIAGALAAAGVKRLAVVGAPGGPALVARLGAAGIGLEPLDGLAPDACRRCLEEVPAVLTAADFALERTGTLVFTPATLPFRGAAGLPPWHIAVLPHARVVADLAALFASHPEVTRQPLLFVSGPSRTADIEKTLVLGAHGPARLDVVVVGGAA
ncbi:MAG: LUD domain-containing protein [Planctomycetes bacterium]|nr:LUD domain-containing protein [Planctomycetota bacterium]